MLRELQKKAVRRVVGMMSGTSVDGVDAAVVEIGGSAAAPQVKLLAFENRPYPPAVREQIFRLFQPQSATVDRVGYMNFLLGELYASAARSVIEKAGLRPGDIDLIGSHGQTIWHQPEICEKDGYPIRYTVQIGEGAVIAGRTGIPTVSDFRVADMAMGGQGAPLVPFSEYLLYRREDETILLQNIGGIGNMTVMPAKAKPEEVYAFDTGPGNMIIDAVTAAVTGGKQTFDEGGRLGGSGTVNQKLLAWLQQEPYYARPLPKTTGRERFGTQYTAKILDWRKTHPISDADLVATLIVGGGGSYNSTLLGDLTRRFAPHGVKVRTQEELGWSSDAKEAVAFALLADCCVRERTNTLPSVTGASEAVIMGKISLPARGNGACS